MNRTSFISLNKPSKNIVGSGNMGYIECPYDHLVNLFGEPVLPTDNYKTSAEWHIDVRRNDKHVGTVAIYDYKQHKGYTKDGKDTHEITDWNIGCKSASIAGEVMSFIKHPHLTKYSEHHRKTQQNV